MSRIASIARFIGLTPAWGLALALCILGLVRSAPAAGEGRILDRLLIELNRVSYSQRYVEMYSVAKGLLDPHASGTPPVAGENNWPAILDDFRDDLLVDQESKRITGVNIDKTVVENALNVIRQKRAEDPAVHAYLQRLGADDALLHKAVLSILNVKLFLTNKQKKEGVTGSASTAVLDKKAPWFVKLEQVTPYRFFEDAHKYVPLSPMP